MSGLVSDGVSAKAAELEDRILLQRENFQGQIRGLQDLLEEKTRALEAVAGGRLPVAGEDATVVSLERVQGLIREECDGVREMLLGKNLAYGNSAVEPLRCFSKAGPMEQLDVRIDDKLSRVMRGSAAGEDVELDLVGYLILKRVARRVNQGKGDGEE